MTMQMFAPLPQMVEDALRESIKQFGVLVPVAVDQHGRTLDGHHRSRIAEEEGVPLRYDIIQVRDDEHAREIARHLNTRRRHLTGDELREHILFLAQKVDDAGIGLYSQPTIAAVAGVTQGYVNQVLSDDGLISTNKLPAARRGADGKVRKATRTRIVAAKNKREADRAIAAINDAGGQLALSSDVVDVKQVERAARMTAADRARQAEIADEHAEADVVVRLGDFRQVLNDIADASVDVILTDPPYPAEYLPLWSDLGEFAARVLKPDGVLVAMSGQTHLPDVYRRLGEHLTYRWTMAYLTPGASYQSQARNVASQWKPILVYGGTERRFFDIAKSEADDKRHHHWGQSESGIDALLRQFAKPGELVCDPFVGGGTTPLVAREYGCSFIGAEIDKASYKAAVERLAA